MEIARDSNIHVNNIKVVLLHQAFFYKAEQRIYILSYIFATVFI